MNEPKTPQKDIKRSSVRTGTAKGLSRPSGGQAEARSISCTGVARWAVRRFQQWRVGAVENASRTARCVKQNALPVFATIGGNRSHSPDLSFQPCSSTTHHVRTHLVERGRYRVLTKNKNSRTIIQGQQMAVSKLGLEGDSVLPKGRRSTSKGPSRLSIRVPVTTLDQGMRPPWGSKVLTSKNIPRGLTT